MEGAAAGLISSPSPVPKEIKDFAPVQKSSFPWSTQPAAAFSLPPPALGWLRGLRALSPGLAGELWPSHVPSHAWGGFLSPRSPRWGRTESRGCVCYDTAPCAVTVTLPRVATLGRHCCHPQPPAVLCLAPSPAGLSTAPGGVVVGTPCCWYHVGQPWISPWVKVSSTIIYPSVPQGLRAPSCWSLGVIMGGC